MTAQSLTTKIKIAGIIQDMMGHKHSILYVVKHSQTKASSEPGFKTNHINAFILYKVNSNNVLVPQYLLSLPSGS